MAVRLASATSRALLQPRRRTPSCSTPCTRSFQCLHGLAGERSAFGSASPAISSKRCGWLSRTTRSSQLSARSVIAKANNRPDGADRAVSALPYLLPLLDGLRYGKFFFLEYPAFSKLLAPLLPLMDFYFNFVFAPLIVFFGLYFGVVNNYSFSRYVRFNAMQAILLDVLLVLPGVVERVLIKVPPPGTWGFQLYVTYYNTIWLFTLICVAYGIAASVVGTTARLPLVADAADQQVQ